MALSGESIKVVGLKEFLKELKALDEPGLLQALKDVNYEVAQLVVSEAQGTASGRMESAAAASLKPGRQAAKAVVSGGGAGTPFFGGAEFGANRNQLRRSGTRTVRGWNQFQPWRGSGSGAGYFLYPAIRATREQVIDMYGDAVEKLAKQAFPD